MEHNQGASAKADQALAVPVEPVSRLHPSGFDPSREAALMTKQERRFLIATPAQSFAGAGWIALQAGSKGGGRSYAGFARLNAWLLRRTSNRYGRLEYRLSTDGYWVREAAIALEAERTEA